MRHVISLRKGMLSGAFVIIFFSLSIVGCKKESTEEIPKLSISDIHKDPLFQDYVSKMQIQYNAVQDYTQLARIINDGKINNDEVDIIHTVFGYSSKEEFRFTYIQLSNIVRQLCKKYDFNAYTNEEKKRLY